MRPERSAAYGSDPKQALDVYAPSHASGAPIIVMVHGGGWRRGDKAAARVVQNKVAYFVPRGYLFVSVNYRLMPQVRYASEVEDVARALAFVQHNAARWGGDPAHIVVMGHSAGAQLVTLIAAAPTIRERFGVRPWQGTIALDSAAYNVPQIMRAPHPRLYDQAFGADNPRRWRAASPTLRLQSALPMPMLLVCSSLRANSCGQARQFAQKAESFGGHARVLPLALSHRQLNADVGTPGTLTDDVAGFIRSTLAG